MNNRHYRISATDDEGLALYFDRHGFVRSPPFAHCYENLEETVPLARTLAEEHRREVFILDAEGVVVLSAERPWRPVTELPPLSENLYGWPMSVPVLGFFTDGERKVVTCERHDADCAPEWRTACSERWQVTDRVTHWRPLPPGPNAFPDRASAADRPPVA